MISSTEARRVENTIKDIEYTLADTQKILIALHDKALAHVGDVSNETVEYYGELADDYDTLCDTCVKYIGPFSFNGDSYPDGDAIDYLFEKIDELRNWCMEAQWLLEFEIREGV